VVPVCACTAMCLPRHRPTRRGATPRRSVAASGLQAPPAEVTRPSVSALCCHRAADHALDGGDDLQQQDIMHQPGTGCCKHCNEIIVHAILNVAQSSTMPRSVAASLMSSSKAAWEQASPRKGLVPPETVMPTARTAPTLIPNPRRRRDPP